MILFGIHIGRLSSEQKIKLGLLKKVIKIMATIDEAVAQLAAANDSLKSANTRLANTKTVIDKIGTETDRLLKQIEDLPLGNAPQVLVDAIDALKETVTAQQDLIASVETSGAAVDAKVEDAPPTP